MTSIEHSGSKLFDFGDELKLEPAIYENTYKNPGPEWIIEASTVYNDAELINYPFSSYYKISVPQNYQIGNDLCNINVNMSSIRQLELIFKVWIKK